MMSGSTSETSINFYQTTRRVIAEDSHLHSHRRENLKSRYVNREVRARAAREEILRFPLDRRLCRTQNANLIGLNIFGVSCSDRYLPYLKIPYKICYSYSY